MPPRRSPRLDLSLIAPALLAVAGCVGIIDGTSQQRDDGNSPDAAAPGAPDADPIALL